MKLGLCNASTSCRDPDERNPCYNAHFCILPKGHYDAHESPDHKGFSWTDATTKFEFEAQG